MSNDGPKIIVGVPGTWRGQRGLVEAVACAGLTETASIAEGNPPTAGRHPYLFAGSIYMDVATHDAWELDLYERDTNLVRAFAIAGQRSLSEDDLTAIAAHTCTAYLISEGGSAAAAQRTMDAASGLLHAGGTAVKVESTGIAHSKADWLALTARREPVALFHAYVTLIGDNDEVYSCGMHNLGLPDATIAGRASHPDSTTTLYRFLLYVLLEKPELRSGQTFSTDADAPHYRLALNQCDRYPTDDPFFNPFGIWQLTPMNG